MSGLLASLPLLCPPPTPLSLSPAGNPPASWPPQHHLAHFWKLLFDLMLCRSGVPSFPSPPNPTPSSGQQVLLRIPTSPPRNVPRPLRSTQSPLQGGRECPEGRAQSPHVTDEETEPRARRATPKFTHQPEPGLESKTRWYRRFQAATSSGPLGPGKPLQTSRGCPQPPGSCGGRPARREPPLLTPAALQARPDSRGAEEPGGLRPGPASPGLGGLVTLGSVSVWTMRPAAPRDGGLERGRVCAGTSGRSLRAAARARRRLAPRPFPARPPGPRAPGREEARPEAAPAPPARRRPEARGRPSSAAGPRAPHLGTPR